MSKGLFVTIFLSLSDHSCFIFLQIVTSSVMVKVVNRFCTDTAYHAHDMCLRFAVLQLGITTHCTHNQEAIVLVFTRSRFTILSCRDPTTSLIASGGIAMFCLSDLVSKRIYSTFQWHLCRSRNVVKRYIFSFRSSRFQLLATTT